MKWRFIEFQRYSPYFKTGLNQAVMESVGDGADPVVFLAGWGRKCVNIGRSQTVEDEIDIEKVREDDIAVVRRQGGGGTTFLTPHGEITWGIVAPAEFFNDDVNSVYRNVCGTIADALDDLGIVAEHEPVNDVVTGGKKISGATLRRKDGAVYVGGTLLYELNVEEMFEYLTPSEDKLDDKPIEDFRDRVTSIKQVSDAGFNEVQSALKDRLLAGKDWREAEWSDSEMERAEDLADKYLNRKWIYRE